MDKYTDEQVTEAIHEVVAELGEDYVYEPQPTADPLGGPKDTVAYCRYAPDAVNTLGCIAGATIRRLGYTGGIAERTAVRENITFSRRLSECALEALNKAQAKQDARESWGSAKEAFDQVMHDYPRDLVVGSQVE